jgi:glycosyltransferase involved in cell wall biosynthesis
VERSRLRRVHILAWRDLDDPEAGGSELHAAMVAKLWTEAGLDVTMRTSFAQGRVRDGKRDGYRVVRRNGRYGVFPAAVLSELMGERGRLGHADGILEVWNGVPWLSPVWARVPKAVMIHHVHQDMWDLVLRPGLASFGRNLEAKWAPPAYRKTDIVTPSASTRDEVIDILGMKPARVSVASPGIDDRFHPGSEPLSPVPMIVAAGRLMPTKRFDEVIRIAAEVRETHPDLQLVIVGQGYVRPELERLIDDLGAHDWVRLTGYVSDDELVTIYRRAWLVVSASIAEGWGMTLTEAAACGTPAVVSRINGHCDSIIDDVTGYLADDSREMVQRITQVLGDQALRSRLAERARKRAVQFTWEACAYGTFLPLARAGAAHYGRADTR